MRELFNRFGGDRIKVIKAYAEAEQRGEVQRNRDNHGLNANEYAILLFADGISKGWLPKPLEQIRAEIFPNIPIDHEFVISLTRFDNTAYIESRVSMEPKKLQGSLRTTLSYLYLTNGPFNLPKNRFDLAFDCLESAERVVSSWLYTRTNANLRSTYGRQALLAARGSRYRCQQCGFSDVRTLNLDHIEGRVINTSFACLCANCHTIKSRQRDWTGARKYNLTPPTTE